MASIYNETMIKLYKYGVQDSYNKSCYDGGLYKGYMFENGGYYSKNCSYGYAHYNPRKNTFIYTMGYKGLMLINKWFKIYTIDGYSRLQIYDEEKEKQYLQLLKDFKLKYDWYNTDFRTTKGKKIKDKLKSGVLLYFKL